MADLQKLIVTVAADVSAFTRGMDKAKGDTEKFASAASSSVAGIRATLGTLSGIAGAVGVGLGLSEAVQTLREFGKLEASLKTITGSADNASRAMEQIRKFATETPFDVQEVTKAFIRLNLYGFDASEKAMRALGNTASAVGVGMIDAVDAIAAAARGEFDPIEKFGVGIKKNGEELKVTFNGVTRTIENNARAIEGVLVELGNTKFAGAMKNQMDEIDGAISNLKDSFDGLVTTIGNLGVTDALKRAFAGASEFISALSKQINSVFGSGIQAQIDAMEIRSKELSREYSKAQEFRDSRIGGSLFFSDEEMARLDRDHHNVNESLAALRRQRDELNKTPVIPTIPESSQSGIKSAAGGVEKIAKAAKSAKQSSVELTSVFDEWEARGGKFADVISGDFEKLAAPKINADDITSVFDELNAKKLDEDLINPKFAEDTQNLSDATRELGLTFTSAFESAVAGGRSLSDVLKGLAQDLAQLAVRKLFTEPAVDAASKAVGSIDWGSLVGGLFGGARASGGPVTAGKAYLVGERRPELFVPGMSGAIIPGIAAVGGGGGASVQIIDQRGASSPAAEVQRDRDPTTGRETIRVMIREEMKSALSSGHLDKAMTMNFGVKRQGVQR